MNKLKLFVILFLLSFSALAQSPPDTMFIIILAGQSNMAGRGVITPSDTVTYPNIYSLNRDSNWVTAKNPLHYYTQLDGVGPGLNFANELSIKYGNNIKIGLVPCAIGGTSIEYWLGDSLINGYHIYSNLIKRAKFSQKTGKIIGVLWHQGESNATGTSYKNYKEKLKSFVVKLRNDLQNPELPFIAAELGTFLQNYPYRSFSDSIKRDLSEIKTELINFNYVSSVGLTDNGDKVHFDSYSQRELGSRYANVLVEFNNELEIQAGSYSGFVGRSFEFPVFINQTIPNNIISNNIISYQFDFGYDSSKLEYLGYSLSGTIADNGMIQINPISGKLSVAWVRQTPINDLGAILKLQFKSLDSGTSAAIITNPFFNSNIVTSITNSKITSIYNYGDIDATDLVQAYDAALVLEYSVGLDPIPEIDSLPWDNWRVTVSDVDGTTGITANDASEIIKYTVGLIPQFAVEGGTGGSNQGGGNGSQRKSETVELITASVENDTVVFRSNGELSGLNLNVNENKELLGSPLIINPNMLSATNISSTKYTIGLATAYSPASDEIFMKIPYTSMQSKTVTFEMIVNNIQIQLTIDLTPSLYFISSLLTGNTYCEGNEIKYQIDVNADYPSDNNFIIQLSDTTGNFDNPINLNTINSTGSVIISSSFPDSLFFGGKYFTRLESTHPEAYSSQDSITFFKKPTSSFSLNNIVCQNMNSTITFTGNASNAAAFIWDFDSANIVTGSGAGPYIINWKTPGTKNVTLYIDDNDCLSSKTINQIENNPIPTPAIVSPVNICFNSSANISYYGSASDTANYNWSFDNGNVISGSGAGPYLVSWSNSGSKLLTLEVFDNGCSSDTSFKIIVNSQTPPLSICMVGVDSLNHNMIVWDQTIINPYDSIIIFKETSESNIYVKVGSQAASDIPVFTDVNSNPDQNSGSYKIAVLDTCGFETSQSDFHKTIHLTINSGPGNAWNLIWDGYQGFNFSSYFIYRGTSIDSLSEIAELQSNILTYTDLTPPVGTVYYQVEVQNPNLCNISNPLSNDNYYGFSRSNIATAYQITSLLDNSLNKIEIWPNPAENKLYVKSEKIKENIDISILSMDGKVFIKEQNNSLITELDISFLKSGIYILMLKTNNNIITRKVIKR